MNKLLYILLFMLVAGTVSCHRTSEVEARLIAIDSLIPAAPDSALSLLEAIDTASLRGEMRAYHALLTAQALYKAYIPATSDSLINRAWDYYKDHGSYDRRIRAMLYKGTTAEELGHPDTAMYWYKRTELESRPDDHYHRGYAFEKMALLYTSVYETRLAIAKYRFALPEFESVNDTSNILFCTLSLSKLYMDYNNDSALYYGEKMQHYAVVFKRPEYLVYYKGIKGKLLFYDGKYKQAKDSILVVIRKNNEISNNTYLLLSLSYAGINRLDSAQFYLNEVKKPFNINDSIQYFFLQSVLSNKRNDIKGSIKYNDISNELAACEILESKENNYQETEILQESIFRQNKEQESVSRFYISAFFIVLVFVIVLFLSFNQYKYRKQRLEIKELQRFTQKLQALNCKLQISHDNILTSNNISDSIEKHEEFNELVMITSNLAEAFRFILTNIRKNIGKDHDKKKLDGIIRKSLTPAYFNYLHRYVDYAYNGLASEMMSSKKLKDDEINVICMYLCRMPSSVMRIYTGLSSIQSVTRKRNHISSKYFGDKHKLESLLIANKKI